MTNSAMPDFFIIGAMKAGTTTLYEYLRRHPEIFMPEEKEPFYFAWPEREDIKKLRLPQGQTTISAESWMIVRNRTSYLRLFNRALPGQKKGEASTFYLPDPYAAGRIKTAAPAARIIAILRDPAERAYSAFTFQQSLGLEPAGSFREAIESELNGSREEWLYGWRHLDCGRYARQLKRYFSKFDEKHILVLHFEDLKKNAPETMRRIFKFLEVDPSFVLPAIEPANQTSLPPPGLLKNAKFLLSRPNLLKDSLKPIVPRAVKRQVKAAVFDFVERYSQKPQPLAAAERAWVIEQLEPDRLELQGLLGWQLSDWAKT